MKMFDYKTIKIKDNKRSIISETVIIEGTINSSELLEVAGLIKGPVNAKVLIIKETGSIIGSIEAELLLINGHFDGKASASEITIGATGTVKGNIEFGNNFKTENGISQSEHVSIIKGKLDMIFNDFYNNKYDLILVSHGNSIGIILKYFFDIQFNFEDWKKINMPDMYYLEFNNENIITNYKRDIEGIEKIFTI